MGQYNDALLKLGERMGALISIGTLTGARIGDRCVVVTVKTLRSNFDLLVENDLT